MADPRKDSPTVIGPDAAFKGELTFQGSVRVEGKFEGSVNTTGAVLVGEGGKMAAEIKAGSVTVDGEIEGNVEAGDRVELNAGGRLVGDLKASKLVVKEGATLVGRLEVGAAGATTPPAKASADAMRQVTAAAQGRK